MAARKPKADWEAVERDYRVGVLSVRELGRVHGLDDKTIRERAKKHGWQRDLADRVRVAAEEEIARRDGAPADVIPQALHAPAREIPDETIVANAAKRISDVVLTHRADIRRLAEQKRSILDRLEKKRKLDEDITAGQADMPLKWIPLSLAEESQILESVARIEAKIIPLERQAHSLDAKVGKPGEPGEGDGKPKAAYFVVPAKAPSPPEPEPEPSDEEEDA